MPGAFAGKAHKTVFIASVPPVEAPMATIFSVVFKGMFLVLLAMTASAVKRSSTSSMAFVVNC